MVRGALEFTGATSRDYKRETVTECQQGVEKQQTGAVQY